MSREFQTALAFDRYVATGKPEQQAAWQKIYEQARLSDAQRSLLRGFVREMNVLVVSGIWCGDCVQQCPLLARIAEAAPERVHLRFVDRDAHPDLSARLTINAGHRVPVALFLAEDCELVAVFGDRTLARYRALAARQLGPTCPLPGAPVSDDELAATLQDWLNEFERVQLLLRLSGRLRQKHDD
jgi:thiol-disulfide isomerase/thioredoxin